MTARCRGRTAPCTLSTTTIHKQEEPMSEETKKEAGETSLAILRSMIEVRIINLSNQLKTENAKLNQAASNIDAITGAYKEAEKWLATVNGIDTGTINPGTLEAAMKQMEASNGKTA
jgi:hypothetical protein